MSGSVDKGAVFSTLACIGFFQRGGRVESWIDAYLRQAEWANEGLRQGLRLQKRWWIGPRLLALRDLERCCGPEPEMTYSEPEDQWLAKIRRLERRLREPERMPPTIVQYDGKGLVVRDGNHRMAAFQRAKWRRCYAFIWCDSAVAVAGFMRSYAPIRPVT